MSTSKKMDKIVDGMFESIAKVCDPCFVEAARDYYQTGTPLPNLIDSKESVSFFHEGVYITVSAHFKGDEILDPEIIVNGDIFTLLDSSRPACEILDDLYRKCDSVRGLE